MRILIVEDSPTDRELLRCLLEPQLENAEFLEASNLQKAHQILDQGPVNCILLDLQLPDSIGGETFEKLMARSPDLPIVVMTNNKDRELALEMIREGAADFIIKDYTDAEGLFRRIIFAVEKHRRSVRMVPESAELVHRLEKAQAKMLVSNQEHTGNKGFCRMHAKTLATTAAMADVTKNTFTGLQTVAARVQETNARQEAMSKTVACLNEALITGTPEKPSMSSRMEQLHYRVENIERAYGKNTPKGHLNLTLKALLAFLMAILLVIATTVAYKQLQDNSEEPPNEIQQTERIYLSGTTGGIPRLFRSSSLNL
jgi:CheY-like chemotaxis protein